MTGLRVQWGELFNNRRRFQPGLPQEHCALWKALADLDRVTESRMRRWSAHLTSISRVCASSSRGRVCSSV
ncbi:hypothetical protein J6590_070150 [Homalodisca vitripennis]|nr:hypothetical protein J6590_070150 [Homalodisca vitripennis]